MAAKTVGFAVADDDRPLLDRLVERYGHGNRSLQDRVHAQVGQIYSPTQGNELAGRPRWFNSRGRGREC